MLRCGVDLIEIRRVQEAIQRHGDRFLHRVFTEEEIAYCQRKKQPWANYAVRFAAKEALFKSLLPRTLDHFIWREIGVTRDHSGAPSLIFSGATAERLAGWQFSLSLSHARETAIAHVLALPPHQKAGDFQPAPF